MRLPKTLIPRKGYMERIKPFMRKDIAKVLVGQRRVGKSFLLFQVMKHILEEEADANIIYINMEDFAFSHIHTVEDLYAHITSLLRATGYNYIFIDEIQEIPQFEKAIRSLLLSSNNDLYLTGSNAKMLSGELASYLSGRYIAFNVYSLSYLEFLDFHQLKNFHHLHYLKFLLILLMIFQNRHFQFSSSFTSLISLIIVPFFNFVVIILPTLICFISFTTLLSTKVTLYPLFKIL